MIPDIGAPELLLVLVVVMMIFGVGKLPEVGGAIGKGIREFRRASAPEGPVRERQPGLEPPISEVSVSQGDTGDE